MGNFTTYTDSYEKCYSNLVRLEKDPSFATVREVINDAFGFNATDNPFDEISEDYDCVDFTAEENDLTKEEFINAVKSKLDSPAYIKLYELSTSKGRPASITADLYISYKDSYIVWPIEYDILYLVDVYNSTHKKAKSA